MSDQIEFRKGVFYSFAWLETQLAGTVSLDQFLAVLNLKCTGRTRLFQNGIFGDEILRAIEDTTHRNEAPQMQTQEVLRPVLPRKRGRPRKYNLKPAVLDLTKSGK